MNKVRLMVLVFGVCSASYILYLIFSANEYAPVNGAVLELESEINVGEIEENQEINIPVSFTNKGSRPLLIKEIVGGCKCIIAKLNKNEYQAGQSGVVSVTFSPSGQPGSKIEQVITFVSNDYHDEMKQILLKGKIKPGLVLKPGIINLGHMGLSEKKITKMYLSSYGQECNFEIDSIVTDIPNAKISYSLVGDLANIEGKNSIYEIEVLIESPDKLGDISGELVIKHTSKLSPELKVPINGKVVTDFIVSPSRLFLRDCNPDFVREVKISNKTPFTLDLMCNPYFMLTSQSSFPTTEAVIIVESGNQKLPTRAGEILISVVGVKEKEIKIPYYVNTGR